VAIPFVPGSSTFGGASTRVDVIAERILSLSDEETANLLSETRRRFEGRHRDLEAVWEAGYLQAAAQSERMHDVSTSRRLLLGACFVQEYSYEAAALCNPSIVATVSEPAADGSLPFVMSLRAIGEGHISSIEFRSGTVHAGGRVEIDPPTPYSVSGRRRSPVYEKETFVAKLDELGADPIIARKVFEGIDENFELAHLEWEIADFERTEISSAAAFETMHLIHWLASSNYELSFDDGPISERVMAPAGPADSRGMEDARFVRFVDDDGSVTYYATYTAWDGHTVLPQMIQTRDFLRFRIATLNGSALHNTGMALFPRRIDGLFFALSRHDQESIFVMRSDHPRFWHATELVYAPTEPWESIQLGNCGSPIETEAGWLVITHGVGPMRQYAIGAILLDIDDPAKVIARLRQPLIEPGPEEREGYVPNVVYSCGGLVHDGHLVLPYGVADRAVRIATVDLAELIGAME
jgi:predicted GH43/DUF377 family glycosyl hydrolase